MQLKPLVVIFAEYQLEVCLSINTKNKHIISIFHLVRTENYWKSFEKHVGTFIKNKKKISSKDRFASGLTTEETIC